jgi:anaerobic selenocysteine-containing dehydrogenase
MDMGMQMGPYSESQGSEFKLTMDVVRASPSGIDLGPLKPQLPQRLRTVGKIIHCATAEPIADLGRLRDQFINLPQSEDEPKPLQLIGRRHVRDNNSWMHNHHRLVKGKNRCTLMMHPQDMAQRNLTDGGIVSVSSRVGTVSVAVQAAQTMMPGVVSLPHGYGHNRPGIKMKIAQEHAGVSCNDLTDELALDELSGNAAVNGVPVSVSAVQDAT